MRVFVLGGFADSLINFRGVLLRTLIENDHDVTVCAPDASMDTQKKLAEMGVTYRNISLNRTGFNPLSDVKTFLMLFILFRKIKPDVLFSYTIKPVIYGSLAARLAGVPAIYSMITGLGYVFSLENRKKKWLVPLAKFLYRQALMGNKRVFFQNPDDRSFFITEKIINHIKKTVLINGSGVNLQHFRHAPVTEGPLSFLLIARLIKDKGLVEYAEAARLIKCSYPTVQFRLLGPLDSNPSAITATQINEWKAENAIIYLGEALDVRPFIQDCSVYVLPSYYPEGTPRTILEAMAIGRPIITTDAPGCRETVVDGDNGFLVPIKSVDGLVEAMKRFIIEPNLIARMGRRSRDIAEHKYDVDKVNAIMLREMGISSSSENHQKNKNEFC